MCYKPDIHCALAWRINADMNDFVHLLVMGSCGKTVNMMRCVPAPSLYTQGYS